MTFRTDFADLLKKEKKLELYKNRQRQHRLRILGSEWCSVQIEIPFQNPNYQSLTGKFVKWWTPEIVIAFQGGSDRPQHSYDSILAEPLSVLSCDK